MIIKKHWNIEISFGKEYELSFDNMEGANEYKNLFKIAFLRTIRETGIIPISGDCISTIKNVNNRTRGAKIVKRFFRPDDQTILFKLDFNNQFGYV